MDETLEKKADVAQVSEIEITSTSSADETSCSPAFEIDTEKILEFVLDKVRYVSTEEALQILVHAQDYHADDYNFPIDTMDKIDKLVSLSAGGKEGTDEFYDIEMRIEATLMKYYSPYPEVRAVVSPIDDPSAYVETPRAYFIGLFWSAVGSYICELFQPRQPSITLPATVLQLLVYPSGLLLARVLPNWSCTVRGHNISLNPGPWTYKEQMFTTIMVNTGGRFSNLINHVLIISLPVFFDQSWGLQFGFMLLMNISTEFFGFGMAGVLRRWVVWNPKAVWPTIMPTLAINKALMLPESKIAINGWTITRYRLLFLCMAVSFVYFFLPNFLFKALSTFNWMTWIAPQNKNLAIVTGSKLGLGFNPITTFDWNVINYTSPLVKPFFATLNLYAGALGSGLLILALYYKNYKYSAYLPINSANTFANDGHQYNVSRVSTGSVLNRANYENYSPPYLSIGNLIRQGSAFAQYTLSFVFVLLTDWKLLVDTFAGIYRGLFRKREKSQVSEYSDPMNKLISVYEEVPDWWYFTIIIVCFLMGVIAFEVYPVNVPVWIIPTILAISMAMLVPGAIVYAVSGYQLVLNDFMALLGGYLIPGNGIGTLMCRFYGWNMDVQAETFVSDLKLGHYAKIPPRAVFRGQMVATTLHLFVTIGSIKTIVATMPGLCTSAQESKFTCPTENGMFTSATMFGTIGPDRVFNTLYPGLVYCFLVGFLVAVLTWYGRRRFPNILRYVHPLIIMAGFSVWGQTYNLSYYTPGLIAAFFFMYIIKRRYIAWWTKYNYVLTSGLTAGTAFSAIVIFGAINYTQTEVVWWGNTVSSAGVDGTQTALLEVPEDGYFGLPIGEFA
ncbi:OPT oligopeptide transporter protein-domain-containing protein [Myxozyma melibiosi]|uniref:OPT oligopeptide transporter protein-domain-containing protein n=1 Tax=Myxozyma melibiosi TaxID=54550 RepID=A0ABR1F2J3_9ASCO